MNKAKTIQQKQLFEVLQEPEDTQVLLLQHATHLALMLVNQLLENQVQGFTGERYSHAAGGSKPMVRHGFNPGSVRIQEKKYPVQVPRVRDRDSDRCVSLPLWENIKNSQGPDQLLLQRLLLGVVWVVFPVFILGERRQGRCGGHQGDGGCEQLLLHRSPPDGSRPPCPKTKWLSLNSG